MKIWTIKIECVAGWYLEERVSKICEVKSNFDLESLCYFILESFNFDHDHLHEFFTSRSPRISRSSHSIEDESVTLDEIFPLENKQQLFMLFDFGDSWVFKITRSRKKATCMEKVTYPRVIEHQGSNPEQYPMCEE